METLPNCVKCQSEYVYEDGALLVALSVPTNGTQLNLLRKMPFLQLMQMEIVWQMVIQ